MSAEDAGSRAAQTSSERSFRTHGVGRFSAHRLLDPRRQLAAGSPTRRRAPPARSDGDRRAARWCAVRAAASRPRGGRTAARAALKRCRGSRRPGSVASYTSTTTLGVAQLGRRSRAARCDPLDAPPSNATRVVAPTSERAVAAPAERRSGVVQCLRDLVSPLRASASRCLVPEDTRGRAPSPALRSRPGQAPAPGRSSHRRARPRGRRSHIPAGTTSEGELGEQTRARRGRRRARSTAPSRPRTPRRRTERVRAADLPPELACTAASASSSSARWSRRDAPRRSRSGRPRAPRRGAATRRPARAQALELGVVRRPGEIGVLGPDGLRVVVREERRVLVARPRRPLEPAGEARRAAARAAPSAGSRTRPRASARA